MSQEIKYTTDGKKVVVLGNLNSQEKIVQEIFVADGSEIPSGEHFVVKSLHDKPAISWKESELIKIESRYEVDHKRLNDAIEKMNKTYNQKSSILESKIRAIGKLVQEFSENSFNQLIDFVTGNVKYVVIDNYGTLEISEYDLRIASFSEYGRFESLRLLSVFGRTDGDLQYKMNQYYDGSGSWINVTPFSDKESALVFLKGLFNEKLLKNGLSRDLIKCAERYNIEIPVDAMNAWNEKIKANITKDLEALNARVAEKELELSKLTSNTQS